MTRTGCSLGSSVSGVGIAGGENVGVGGRKTACVGSPVAVDPKRGLGANDGVAAGGVLAGKVQATMPATSDTHNARRRYLLINSHYLFHCALELEFLIGKTGGCTRDMARVEKRKSTP